MHQVCLPRVLVRVELGLVKDLIVLVQRLERAALVVGRRRRQPAADWRQGDTLNEGGTFEANEALPF